MRNIRVTGGYSDFAVGTLVERNGKSLVLSTIKAMLVRTDAVLPERDSADWRTPDEITFAQPSQARISLLVDDSTPVGNYHLWAVALDNPTATPVRAGNHMIIVT